MAWVAIDIRACPQCMFARCPWSKILGSGVGGDGGVRVGTMWPQVMWVRVTGILEWHV